MRSFLLALQFLTVLTIRPDLLASQEEMARSRAWYGLVGGILGAALAICAWLLGRWLPPLALAGVLVLLWGAFTRFLHYDGVADTADALVHTTSTKRALEIMKDTRLGSFGVAMVVCVMLVKFGALASMSLPHMLAALVAAPALARALAGAMAGFLPAARPGQGLGASVADNKSMWPDFLSMVTSLVIACLAAGVAGVAAALGVVILGLFLTSWFLRRIGGVTGDTLGASLEFAEATVLIVLAGWWS